MGSYAVAVAVAVRREAISRQPEARNKVIIATSSAVLTADPVLARISEGAGG